MIGYLHTEDYPIPDYPIPGRRVSNHRNRLGKAEAQPLDTYPQKPGWDTSSGKSVQAQFNTVFAFLVSPRIRPNSVSHPPECQELTKSHNSRGRRCQELRHPQFSKGRQEMRHSGGRTCQSSVITNFLKGIPRIPEAGVARSSDMPDAVGARS